MLLGFMQALKILTCLGSGFWVSESQHLSQKCS